MGTLKKAMGINIRRLFLLIKVKTNWKNMKKCWVKSNIKLDYEKKYKNQIYFGMMI